MLTRHCHLLFFLLGGLGLFPASAQEKENQEAGSFRFSEGELIWQHVYTLDDGTDSLQQLLTEFLRGRYFTHNVVRQGNKFTGEIAHLKIDCKRFGRTYINTPKMYWSGEWRGKFSVEYSGGRYRVTVYHLYFETQPDPPHQKTSRYVPRGRYAEVVAKKNRTVFKASERANIALMNVALHDEFNIRNATDFVGEGDW